jgi:acyl-CoA thioesterase II
MSETTSLLSLSDLGGGRFRVNHPDHPPEDRGVVYGGQTLAQMIMACSQAAAEAHEVKSIQIIYARTGSYAEPMELVVEAMHSGRTLSSYTVTAWQGERLISRALVLSSIDEPDLFRHQIRAPEVPGPDEGELGHSLAFPGSEVRLLDQLVDIPTDGGAATSYFWMRHPESVDSIAANQAIVAWATQYPLTVLSIRAHPESVGFEQAHRTFSGGPLAHSIDFHERFVANQWLLFANEATCAGRGRTFGRGGVFTQDGTLVASFAQEGMARIPSEPLDFNRSM